jgi:epoxyqueuosine reductase
MAKEAKLILVVAVEHPENKSELDWWNDQISSSFGIDAFHFPYFIEQGGIYLNDAEVMTS